MMRPQPRCFMPRIVRRIVHPGEQAILDRHRPATARLKPIRRRENVRDGKAFAHRQQAAARGVVRSVEGHRQMDVQARGRERVDTRHDADGGDGDLPPAERAEGVVHAMAAVDAAALGLAVADEIDDGVLHKVFGALIRDAELTMSPAYVRSQAWAGYSCLPS